MSASSFSPGDQVVLKSGGPTMTIQSIENDEAEVVWFDNKKQPQSGTYALVVLQKYTPSMPGIVRAGGGRGGRRRR